MAEHEVPAIIGIEYGEVGTAIRNGYQLRIALLTALGTAAIAMIGLGLEQNRGAFIAFGALLLGCMPGVEAVTKIYLAPFVYRAIVIERKWFPEGTGVYNTYFWFRREKWGEMQLGLSGNDRIAAMESFRLHFIWRHFWLKACAYWGAAVTVSSIGLWIL